MSILTKLQSLVLPFSRTAGGVITAPRRISTQLPIPPDDASAGRGATLSRRTFFSFFGTGIVMLAKPDLFLGQNTRFVATEGNSLISAPPVWTKVGKILRTYVQDGLAKADIEFFRGFSAPATWGGNPILEGVPVLNHAKVGDELYHGPGDQLTTEAPNEEAWRAGAKARGLPPDGVYNVEHPVPIKESCWVPDAEKMDLDEYVRRWPAGNPMPALHPFAPEDLPRNYGRGEVRS